MRTDSQPSAYRVFNRADRFGAGWHWTLPSGQLKVGQVKAVTLLGRELAIYRGRDRQTLAVDAYCPHMGAHLAEGKVEDCAIRCLFHNWKFGADGQCEEIPALAKPLPVRLQTWPSAERYGLIWVWVADGKPGPLPAVPELEGKECDSLLGTRFVKNCHPNVVLLNAIDAHHFNTVHRLPLQIEFAKQQPCPEAIQFSNTTRGGDDSIIIRLLRPLYREQVTYSLCYWYGSTGTVTLGPDFLHFYILFALRLIEGGKTEGQTVLVTPKRRSHVFRRVFNPLLLRLTQQVGHYFAKGDTQIFQTIRFDLKTPTIADRSIVQFIQHVEQQPICRWGSWLPEPMSRSSCVEHEGHHTTSFKSL